MESGRRQPRVPSECPPGPRWARAFRGDFLVPRFPLLIAEPWRTPNCTLI